MIEKFRKSVKKKKNLSIPVLERIRKTFDGERVLLSTMYDKRTIIILSQKRIRI